MKKIVLLFTLLGVFSVFSQQTTYTFTYDTAGNQTQALQRVIIISSTDPFPNTDNPIGKIASPNSMKIELQESLTYYPNPVRDMLFLRWTNTNTESINSFKLYSMTGALLQKYEAMEQNVEYNIPFSEYPNGAYIVTIGYTSGVERSVKIIKN